MYKLSPHSDQSDDEISIDLVSRYDTHSAGDSDSDSYSDSDSDIDRDSDSTTDTVRAGARAARVVDADVYVSQMETPVDVPYRTTDEHLAATSSDTDTDHRPTMLKRGVVLAAADASEFERNSLASYVGVDYVIERIKFLQNNARSAGDRFLVLRSGTGSGKSTVLPFALMQFGRRQCITEPRRKIVQEIARDISARNPLQAIMGETIGYKTGINSVANRSGIRLVTTGVLKMQLLNSKAADLIHKYSIIMIDEVDTHDLEIDLTLRLLKQFIDNNWSNPRCPIVILASATLVPERYMSYFGTRYFIDIAGPGKNYPVEEHWPAVAVGDTYNAAVTAIRQVHGDTVVFMPTVASIVKYAEKIRTELKNPVFEAYSARLDSHPQEHAMLYSQGDPQHTRVILATNVFESGITIPYLKNAIDTGYKFMVLFNNVSACRVGFLDKISQSAHKQRKGRVGRLSSGTYFPLYTQAAALLFLPETYPEIDVQDVSLPLLQLLIKITGAEFDAENQNVLLFNRVDPLVLGLINQPMSDALTYVYDNLYMLGYIDREWNPTTLGWMASRYTKISAETIKMILASFYHECEARYLIIAAACMTVNDVFGKSVLETATGILGATVLDIHSDVILAIMVYESMVEHIRSGDVDEWMVRHELNARMVNAVIELVNDTMITTLELGMPVEYYCESLLTIRKRSKTEFRAVCDAIVHCIYEGQRLNVCTWHESNTGQSGYTRDYKHTRVQVDQYATGTRPKYVSMDSVFVGQTGARSGKFVTVLDGIVDIDTAYLY